MLPETEKKIRSFGSLPKGWHCGEGGPVRHTTITKALRLLSIAGGLGYTETDAFAGVSGEAMLTIYSGKTYLEFTVEPDESVTFIREEDGEEVEYKEGLTVEEAADELIEARTSSWVTSGYFTPKITTASSDASQDLRLRTLAAAASQSLMGSAPLRGVPPSVPTFDITILGRLANRPSSGLSPTVHFHMDTVLDNTQVTRVMSATATSQDSPTRRLEPFLSKTGGSKTSPSAETATFHALLPVTT